MIVIHLGAVDQNVNSATPNGALRITEILVEGGSQMNCHHIARSVRIHLVLHAAKSMVGNKHLQLVLASNTFVVTKRAKLR